MLWLILTFFAISGHYILLNAQFLAVVNIIVYAGAIMVLFLFVIMLMNVNKDMEPKKNKWLTLAGAIAGVLFAPDKGSETRRKFSEKGRKMADDLKEKWKDAKAGFESEFQK